MQTFTLPAGREPTDEEVSAFHDFMGDADWFSDYDCGISLFINGESHRAGPGQTITKLADGTFAVTGEEAALNNN